jgi:hypothetical protein
MMLKIKRPSLYQNWDEYNPLSPEFWDLDTVAEISANYLPASKLPHKTVIVKKHYGIATAIVARCDAYPLLWLWPWFWLRVADSWGLLHGFLVYLYCTWTGSYIDRGEIPSFKSAMKNLQR